MRRVCFLVVVLAVLLGISFAQSPRYEVMLNRPDIVGLTGGGNTKLDGIATTGLSVGTIVLVYDESSGETRIYRLSDTSGVVSDSIPIVIVPDDYNATTNHKVWKLSMSSDADETGSSDTISPGSGDTTDTIVVAAQLKVYGELIADSIQSAGDTLYIDKPFHSIGFNNVGTATITGLATVNGGINITSGGLDIDAGGINVDAGGLNINAGGASITGAVNVTGSETISNALYVDTIDVESYDSVIVNDDLKVVGDLLVTGSITGSYLGAMDTIWANFSAGKSHTTDTVVTYDNLKVYGELIADSIQSAGDSIYIDKPFHSVGFNNVGTANITGNTDIGGDLNVNGDFSANEGTFSGNLTASSGNITNDLTVGGDLSADSIHASDDVVVSNNLDVSGTGHFGGDVTIDGDLAVNGNLVNGDIKIDTLYRGDKATVTDTIVAYDNFKVYGELIADSIQAVGDVISIKDSIDVNGTVTADSVNVANGVAISSGDLYIGGQALGQDGGATLVGYTNTSYAAFSPSANNVNAALDELVGDIYSGNGNINHSLQRAYEDGATINLDGTVGSIRINDSNDQNILFVKETVNSSAPSYAIRSDFDLAGNTANSSTGSNAISGCIWDNQSSWTKRALGAIGSGIHKVVGSVTYDGYSGVTGSYFSTSANDTVAGALGSWLDVTSGGGTTHLYTGVRGYVDASHRSSSDYYAGYFEGRVKVSSGELIASKITSDTVYAGDFSDVTDTLYLWDNLFVHGELIADSIQAVGDTLEIDDTVVVHGGLIVDEIPNDTTFDSLLTVVEGMVSKVPTSDLVASKTRFSHVLWVDGENGDDATADGSIAKPYKTIQAAINAVSADSFYTIMITPGSYNEALTINNKNITLQSAAGEFDGVGISGGSSPAVTFTADADKWYYFEAHGIIFSSSGHRCLDFTNLGAAMIHECSVNCGHRSDTAIYIDNSSYNWASCSYVTIQDVYTNKGGIYSEDLHSLFVLYSDIAGRIYAKSSSSSNITGLILRHSTVKTASMRNPSNVKDSCLVLDGNVIADIINSNLYSGKIVVNGNSEISKFTGSVADRRIELNGTSKLTCYGSYIDTLVDNTSGDITLYSTNFDHLIVSDNTGAFDVRTGEIMVGDTITEHKYYGIDASGADSFWIYDDGDTTRFDSDNPIKIGHSSLVVGTSGDISLNGSVSFAVKSVTANYTATASDRVILCDATSNSITVSLPSASGITGRVYTIKKVDSSTNTVTVDPAGSETIDGASTYSLSSQWDFVTIVSDGSNWVIVAK